jgi:hypothetical protein
MSSTDLSKSFIRSSSISKITIKTSTSRHSLSRRYSDCNIVFLEEKESKNLDDQKQTLLKRKEELMEEFKKKHINDSKGFFIDGVLDRKYKDCTRYIGTYRP